MITQAKETIENAFPKDWLKSYVTSKQKRLRGEKLKDYLRPILESVLSSFSHSLVSGEYILNEKIENDIDNLKHLISIALDDIGVRNADSQLHLQLVQYNFVDVIKAISTLYLNFIQLIRVHQEDPSVDIIFSSNPSIDKLLSIRKTEQESIEQLYFFSILSRVSIIDHFFQEGNQVYQELVDLDYSLRKNSTATKYKTSVFKKIAYLKYKWVLRQYTNEQSPKAYLLDSELIVPTQQLDYLTNSLLNDHSKWINHINSYYEVTIWENSLRAQANKLLKKPLKDLNVLELLTLLKFFKDVEKSFENLSDIVNRFKTLYSDKKGTFERSTYNKLYSYALNNQFSLLLEDDKTDFDKIRLYKSEILKIQTYCKIDNFFPEAKFLNYSLDYLEKKYDKRAMLSLTDEVDNELLKELDTSIEEYQKQLSWSTSNYNLLYHLPFEESLLRGDDFDTYYASSVVLPLPVEKSTTDFEIIKLRYERIYLLFKSINSLSKEFNEIDRLKTEIKGSDVKTLEIIGVFTGVSAFILTSVSSIPFLQTLENAIYFEAIIGSGLLAMISLIFVFTRGALKRTELPWKVFIVATVLLASIVLFTKHTFREKETNKPALKDSKPFQGSDSSQKTIDSSQKKSKLKSSK